MANRDTTTRRTDEIDRIEKLHGADRGELGEKGWAEAPNDLIGGHPELETAPDPDNGGGLNGPQPDTDVFTGRVKPPKRSAHAEAPDDEEDAQGREPMPVSAPHSQTGTD